MASKNWLAQWINNNLVVSSTAGNPNMENALRVRVTAAQINAGFTLLPALPGYKYRLTDCTLIAVGGSAAGATAVVVTATQAAGGATLISAAVAALTQSAVVKPHTASVAVIADGASFVANDVNTAITIGKTGGSLTTATNIDVVLTYAIER